MHTQDFSTNSSFFIVYILLYYGVKLIIRATIVTARGVTSAHAIEPPAWHDRTHAHAHKTALPGVLSSKLTVMLKPISGRPIRSTSGSIRGAKMASMGENITSIAAAIRSWMKPVPEWCGAQGVRYRRLFNHTL